MDKELTILLNLCLEIGLVLYDGEIAQGTAGPAYSAAFFYHYNIAS